MLSDKNKRMAWIVLALVVLVLLGPLRPQAILDTSSSQVFTYESPSGEVFAGGDLIVDVRIVKSLSNGYDESLDDQEVTPTEEFCTINPTRSGNRLTTNCLAVEYWDGEVLDGVKQWRLLGVLDPKQSTFWSYSPGQDVEVRELSGISPSCSDGVGYEYCEEGTGQMTTRTTDQTVTFDKVNFAFSDYNSLTNQFAHRHDQFESRSGVLLVTRRASRLRIPLPQSVRGLESFQLRVWKARAGSAEVPSYSVVGENFTYESGEGSSPVDDNPGADDGGPSDSSPPVDNRNILQKLWDWLLLFVQGLVGDA